MDDYALGPVARGYRWAVPEPVREALNRFFDNAGFPKRFVANLGQGEGGTAAAELARFAVNTTAGLGGLFDPAAWLGLEPSDEDLGQMLGVWGMPEGPYLVLPLWGPSNIRDATGRTLEIFLDPFTYIGQFVSVPAGAATGAVGLLDTRARNEDEIAAAREAALDYYVLARDAYLKRREHQIEGRDAAPLGEAGDVPDEIYELEADEDSAPPPSGDGAGDAAETP